MQDMRTAALLQSVLMITSVILVSGLVSAEDSETVISTDKTWSGEDSVEGVVRILDGGHLTIEDANIKMIDGSSIHVDEGGQLTITQSTCLLYTSPSPRDLSTSRMPSSA